MGPDGMENARCCTSAHRRWLNHGVKMRKGERGLRRESGHMSLAMMTLALGVLAIGVIALIFGQATDARGKAQKAADSAALAAADDTRKWWARTWLMSQRAPVSSVDYLPPRYPRSSAAAALGAANSTARGPAGDFADRNDSSTLESLWAVPDPSDPSNSIHITVETLSEELEAVGTANVRPDNPQGEAWATSEVRTKSGISCHKVVIPGPPHGLGVLGWYLNCSSSDGTSASAYYLGRTTIPVNILSAQENFAELFEVRLVNPGGL